MAECEIQEFLIRNLCLAKLRRIFFLLFILTQIPTNCDDRDAWIVFDVFSTEGMLIRFRCLLLWSNLVVRVKSAIFRSWGEVFVISSIRSNNIFLRLMFICFFRLSSISLCEYSNLNTHWCFCYFFGSWMLNYRRCRFYICFELNALLFFRFANAKDNFCENDIYKTIALLTANVSRVDW